MNWFQHMFHRDHHRHQPQEHRPQQQGTPVSNKPPPPASRRFLNNLPLAIVTADDLLEESNVECIICFEENNIGDRACKLQCGHLYHPECIRDWLKKSCTCPVCRYEIETDDVAFEAERKRRMQSRKIRCRRDELDTKSISQLRELLKHFDISSAHCFDKRDLIELLIAEGKVEIVKGSPQIEITLEELQQKSVGELKGIMRSYAISTENAVEKADLVQRLLDSGRIALIVSHSHHTSPDSSPSKPAFTTPSSSNSYPAPPSSSAPEIAPIDSMSIRELRMVASGMKIDISDCLERADIIAKLKRR